MTEELLNIIKVESQKEINDMDKYNEFLKNDGPKYYNTYEGFSKHFLTLLKQEYDFQISISKCCI